MSSVLSATSVAYGTFFDQPCERYSAVMADGPFSRGIIVLSVRYNIGSFEDVLRAVHGCVSQSEIDSKRTEWGEEEAECNFKLAWSC